MSGTLHSEEVLKNIFGLDDFKIIEAETMQQGQIEILRTGLEKDCKYSNFSFGRHSREEYLRIQRWSRFHFHPSCAPMRCPDAVCREQCIRSCFQYSCASGCLRCGQMSDHRHRSVRIRTTRQDAGGRRPRRRLQRPQLEFRRGQPRTVECHGCVRARLPSVSPR